MTDEALEKMVPPPKRRIGEDTPLVDMSQQNATDYSIANYTGQFAQNPNNNRIVERAAEMQFNEVEEAPIIELKAKPTVDLKAKMLASKQQKEPLVIQNTLNNKRMKTVVDDPDDTLDSPSNLLPQRPNKDLGKPPLTAHDKRGLSK